MKKKLAIIFAGLMSISLIACGKTEETTEGSEGVSMDVSSEEDSTDVAAEETSEADDTAETSDTVNLDDYIGFYADGDCNEITIDKEGDDYTMEVTIFRLTDIDEGIVSATSEGVVFDATDAAGDPIKLLFREADDEMYELVIEETTWDGFEEGQIYGNFEKYDQNISPVYGEPDLDDGEYSTSLISDDSYEFGYVKNIEVKSDCIVIEGTLQRVIDWETFDMEDLPYGTYTIAIDENTDFLSGGGEEDPEHMTRDEFASYVVKCLDSGLGLDIHIENGVIVEIGIWS